MTVAWKQQSEREKQLPATAGPLELYLGPETCCSWNIKVMSSTADQHLAKKKEKKKQNLVGVASHRCMKVVFYIYINDWCIKGLRSGWSWLPADKCWGGSVWVDKIGTTVDKTTSKVWEEIEIICQKILEKTEIQTSLEKQLRLWSNKVVIDVKDLIS